MGTLVLVLLVVIYASHIVSGALVVNSVIPVMDQMVSSDKYSGLVIHHFITKEGFGKVESILNIRLAMHGSIENTVKIHVIKK